VKNDENVNGFVMFSAMMYLLLRDILVAFFFKSRSI